MTKHIPFEQFKPQPRPSWAWDDIEPHTPRAAAGYIVGTRCLFRAFAVIGGLPIYLGIFLGRAEACRAIVDAHRGEA